MHIERTTQAVMQNHSVQGAGSILNRSEPYEIKLELIDHFSCLTTKALEHLTV